jgi:hypothetical protein
MDKDLLAAVQSIAQSLQPHYWSPSISDVLQFLLVIATGLTVYWLWRYTKETEKLRIATRDQVNVSNLLFFKTKEQLEVNTSMLSETIELRKAAQAQVEAAAQTQEASIMPVLTLDICDQQENTLGVDGRTHVQWKQNLMFLRNLGAGPAFNIKIEVPNKADNVAFDVGSRVLGQGQRIVVWGTVSPGSPEEDSFTPSKAFDWVERDLPNRVAVTIVNESLNRQQYTSNVVIRRIGDAETPSLDIEFTGVG